MRGDKIMAKTSLHAFKAKDTQFVADWLKSKGLHKLCSVFEGIQEPFTLSLACKSVVSQSIKPCLHTQLPEHNKSYRKVSRGWGHLNSFSASGGGNLNKNFPKIQMPGGGCWSFDLTGTLFWNIGKIFIHEPYVKFLKGGSTSGLFFISVNTIIIIWVSVHWDTSSARRNVSLINFTYLKLRSS